MERYSLKQCQAMLGGIDFKTLQRWMTKANIEPMQSKKDERFKYLTREQLEVLAQAHERELPDDQEDTLSEITIPHTAYNLLLDRLSSLEQWQALEQERRSGIEDFREQIFYLSQKVDELTKTTVGLTLLLEERRQQKVTEDSQLANRFADLKLQLDVVQSQANSFVEWYDKLQRIGEQNSRDIQKLNQALQTEQNERQTLAKQVAKLTEDNKRPALSRQRAKTSSS